jgi:hypothetical protein
MRIDEKYCHMITWNMGNTWIEALKKHSPVAQHSKWGTAIKGTNEYRHVQKNTQTNRKSKRGENCIIIVLYCIFEY